MYRISITRRDLWRGFPILLSAGLVYAEKQNRFAVPAHSLDALDNTGVQYRVVGSDPKKPR